MAVVFVSGAKDDVPWSAWSWDLDSYRANFYSTTEPYQRYPVSATGTSREGILELAAQAEERQRAKGLVTFDELPDDVKQYWAERDAAWLAYKIITRND